MKKVILAIAVLLAAPLLLLTVAQSQEDMELVDNSVFHDPQRPPAIFNHDAHNEAAGLEECNQCHHIYEDGQLLEDESSEDQRCSDCHLPKDQGRRPGLTKAFHLNCKGCHLSQASGPILCGECHQS